VTTAALTDASGSRPSARADSPAAGATSGGFFLFCESSNLLLSCGGEEAGVMFDYDITTMRIESAFLFFRRLTYALFIGWVVYAVYLFIVGDWLSLNLLMIFIAFAVSFIVYRTIEIIADKR
jgi:hypothetical protein